MFGIEDTKFISPKFITFGYGGFDADQVSRRRPIKEYCFLKLRRLKEMTVIYVAIVD